MNASVNSLCYLGDQATAKRIDAALRTVLAHVVRTRDLGGTASTTEFTEAIVRVIESA